MNHKELTDILNEVKRDGLFLTDWEVDFIADLIDRPRTFFTENQEISILKIYNERVR